MPKKTAVITTEDMDFWKTMDVVVTETPQEAEITILAESLQKTEDPIKLLRDMKSPKIVVLVPNEWSWPPEYKPFANTAHKQRYDTELLARHLEEAGLLFTIRLIEFNGWSFFGCECTR